VYGAAASNAGVAAACAAGGVPAGYRQVDAAGKEIGSKAGGQSPKAFLTGSNPNLQPETSVTRTLGLVYSPSQVEGLDFSLDWYRINLERTIGSVTANDILDYCYVQNDPAFCGRFQRDASGQITSLTQGLANLGKLTTEGYDFGAHYRLPEFAAGRFTLGLESTYLAKYDLTSGPGQVLQGLAGFASGTLGLYRARANASLDWTLGNFGATWTMRYFGGLRDTCWDVGVECNAPNYTNPWIGDVGASNKGSVTFNDVQFRYQLPWQASFNVGVNNVFNKKGPYYYSVAGSGTGSAPYLPSFDIDRYFYVGYHQKF